jgi:regulatory protein
MEISWKLKEEDPRFLVICLDQEPWKTVYKSLFAFILRRLKGCRSLEELQEVYAKAEDKAAQLVALRALARRGLTAYELEQKLLEKGLSAGAIEKALERCRQLGVLDDLAHLRRVAESYERRGYGPQYIAFKLRHLAKGSLELLEPILQEIKERQEQTLAQYRARRLSRVDWKDPEQKQKAFAALQRRGFDAHAIFQLNR